MGTASLWGDEALFPRRPERRLCHPLDPAACMCVCALTNEILIPIFVEPFFASPMRGCLAFQIFKSRGDFLVCPSNAELGETQ